MMPVLAYWNIRGLAQPIRLLLNYVGEEFEDKMYECGDAPDYNRDCWMNEKFSYGLDYPNLPYYIDGDVKVTQSNAIMRHLGRKHKLDGSTDQEKRRVDLMAEEGMDFRNGIVRLSYNPNFANLKPEYLKNLGAKLELYEKFLGNGKYFAGDNITFVDFIMYELLDQHRILEATCLDQSPKLREFLARFEALPAIKTYMESDKFMKRPINNKMAGFK